MRLDVQVIDVQPAAALREYTQGRLWLGLQRFAPRILCAGVWLTECFGGSAAPPRFVCRIDVWLRQVGHVTVRHVESNPYVAVELAIARLRHKVSHRVRRAVRATGVMAGTEDGWHDGDELQCGHGASQVGRDALPRLALVIERRGRSTASSTFSWLSHNFGVEQLSRMTINASAWDALPARNEDALAPLRDRLALALLGRPVVVAAVASVNASGTTDEESRRERSRVRALVKVVRSWALPVEVVGLWLEPEAGEPRCIIGPPELASQEHEDPRLLPSRRNVDSARPHPPYPHWLAHRVWEDDGGRGQAIANFDGHRSGLAPRRKRREMVTCG